jgi:hypothetical protein
LNNRLLSEGADGSFQQSSSSQQPSGSFTVQLLDRRDCDPKDLQWVDAQRIIRGDAQQQQQQLMFSLDQKSGQLEPGASVPLKIHLRNQKGDYLDGNAGKRQTVTALSQPEYVEAVFKITLQGGSELLDGGDIGDGQQRVIFLRIQTKQ